MEYLKKGETYKIENINELFNCPVNMMEECLKGIRDVFDARIEISKKKGYAINIATPYFVLKNDDEQVTNILFGEKIIEGEII